MAEASPLDAKLDAGLAHHEAGRIAEAEAAYRDILTHDPDHADALNLLGVILQDRGDLAQSIETLQRAVDGEPEFAEAFVNLARAQSAAGDAAAAKASSQRAVKLDPELAEAHVQLARALLFLAENEAAATTARQATVLDPSSADAQLFLGHAAARLKDYAAAEIAYRAADQLAPDRAEILLNYGIVLADLGQFDDAIRLCERALALAPHDSNAHAALGVVLRRSDAISASIDALAEALILDPRNRAAWRQQGDNYALLGKFDAAVDCYDRLHALDPSSPEALSCLAAIGRLGNAGGERQRLEAILSDVPRSPAERIAAGFALGSLLDTDGDYDAAFAAYRAANQLARLSSVSAGVDADLSLFHLRINQLRAAFVQAAFEATAGHGSQSDQPVFIVGMPRSGTTLVEQILASHPKVFGAGERKDIAEIARHLEAGKPTLAPEDWDPKTVRHAAETQLARLQGMGGTADRIIDKLPDNIMLLGHIAVLFPNARVIFCRRDPRDTCLSCFFQNFRDGIGWSNELADCAGRAWDIEILGRHWRDVLPLRMLEVDYETLVGDLESESRRMIEFLGLEWDDRCLSFHTIQRVVQTVSLWQVRQPLYASSVGRWRNYRQHIRPLLDGLAGLVPIDDSDVSVEGILVAARAHLSAGRTEAAKAASNVILDHAPDNIDALRLLAQLARDRGDAHATLTAAHRIIAIDPDDAHAQLLIGSALLDLDDAEGAVEALARAIELTPESADAQLYFAMACMRLSEFRAAADALTEAVRLRPDDPECLTKLGFVLRELGRFHDALPYLRRAVELAPDDSRVHLALVMTLWRTNDVPATEIACNEALRIAPDVAELWLHDAFCKTARGKFSAAADSYSKALALNPLLEEARLGLVGVNDQSSDQVTVAQLRASLDDVTRPARVRAAAGHALGDLLDREASYGSAFDAYARANLLVREANLAAGITSETEIYNRFVDATIAMFSPAMFQATTGLGDLSEVPVFIVGMPRSGTTLVEQIASSHPDVFGAGELRDITNIVPRLENGTAHLPPIVWDRATVAHESAAHLDKLRGLDASAKRIIDKMPDNVQWLGHIAVLFPHARIIICGRDPRDVCLSCYFQHFGESLAWTTDLADLAARARAFDRLVKHWRATLPLPILEVQYEELVQDLESGSRRLIDFLGLEWDPACLTFHQTERTVLTASQWQVRQPLYTSSLGRWRHYREHLGPLLEGLSGLLPPRS